MNDYTSTPRRPIVPGPSGIAAKAVALREQKAREVFNDRPDMPVKLPEPPVNRAPAILPFQGVGNLAKGIAGVMSEVGTIQKTGFNKFHNYAYATLQDLLFAVTPLMGKHGVCVIQNEVERTQVESRIMVTYEFSIFHTSGEMWPDRPRFTGMSIGRNTKGEYDDKAINKCHSAARKYFLLSLFQVPSGDFDDADEGQAERLQQPKAQERAIAPKQSETRERVPGPATPNKQPIVTERADPPQQPIADERLPHKIGFTPGMTADMWAIAYIKVIEKAPDQQEITEWDGLNDATLQRLSDKYPEVYEQVIAATERRMNQLEPRERDPESDSDGMPDPKEDPGAALNWVAQGLVDSKTLQDAEAFWNDKVAPRESEFDPIDWELLMEEFKRNEIRLTPEPPEAA